MLSHKIKKYWRLVKVLGLTTTIKLRFRKEHKDLLVHPKGIAHPLFIRRNSSDIHVFYQIFVGNEYGCLTDNNNARLIIDAGANVGYSSAYFLSRFPHAEIVAVEPDPSNFEALKNNLKGYGQRAKLIHGAVWSETSMLAMETKPYRDGGQWAKQVRAPEEQDTPNIAAMTISDLLKHTTHQRISILKMDVEGAEAVIFSDPKCVEWLNLVDAIAIELHDDSSFGNASRIFHAAIGSQPFAITRSGELTICIRNNSN